MTVRAAAIAVVSLLNATLGFLILYVFNRHRISQAYYQWQLKSGRDVEGHPASRPTVTFPNGASITALETVHPTGVPHLPLAPAIYLNKPPPEPHLTSPPPWVPIGPGRMPPQHPQRPPRPSENQLPSPIPTTPQPMLPTPAPPMSPIPQHSRHLAPQPLQVGPFSENFHQRPKPVPVNLSEVLEVEEKNVTLAMLRHEEQQRQQQQQQQQQRNNTPDLKDTDSARITFLLPGSILRNSTSTTGSGSTGSPTSPRFMESRAHAVRVVSQSPLGQQLRAEMITLPSREPKKEEPPSQAKSAVETLPSQRAQRESFQRANTGAKRNC